MKVSYDAYADYTRKKKVEDEEMRLRLVRGVIVT